MMHMKNKKNHRHRWLELMKGGGTRSYEKCMVKRCPATRRVPDDRQHWFRG